MDSAGDPMLIDWALAKATSRRLLPPGPRLPRDEVQAVVGELRGLAVQAREHVRAYTNLVPEGPEPPVLVIDRPGWVDVNVDSFARLLTPLLRKMADARPGGPSPMVTNVGSRVTGVELGGLLAFVGSKVLGQYEPFTESRGTGARGTESRGTESRGTGAAQRGTGTLLLVAPNIVEVERELGVDPHDFRLWVCLHEETHRTQFTAVPWLAGHILGEIHEFLLGTEVDPGALARQMARTLKGVLEIATGARELSLLDLVGTPEQRVVLDRMTAVMSLLEGHADFVMDGVGPAVVPTVAEIREAFQARRAAPRGLDALLRRLLGMEAKLRQYRDGERFVRGVVSEVGMAGFNEVWSSPEALPTLPEIHDPKAWVARVHGRPAMPAPAQLPRSGA
jgi:coenzyme F420 biosynthesis associated uncharacterized protein